MPSSTILGAGGAVVTIPISSNAASAVAQNALNAISAAVASGAVSRSTFDGTTVPTTSGSAQLLFTSNAAQNATLPAGSNFVSLVSYSTALTSISNASTTAATVVAGSGGLAYTQTAASVSGSLIVAGGGQSVINLAAGANTVSLDVSPVGSSATGVATVNALAGGATVMINAATNNASVSNNALIAAAGRDTVVMSGSGALLLGDATNTVSVLGGGAAFFANLAPGQLATNINLGAGNETIGVLSAGGSTESVTGASSGTIYIAAAPGLGGNLFVNPNGQNVTVFAGAGATTLFGAGDGGNTNTGSDVVLGGTGYFHAGTGGNSLLQSSTSIVGAGTTLIGGGQGDALYAQSANVSLRGSAGTALMAASGVTIAGGITSLGSITVASAAGVVFQSQGASGGDTLNAGASNAAMFGATSGANTIISGSGSSTVFGHSGARGGAGNVYLDGAAGGRMAIADFTATDTFRLTGGQTVSSVSTPAANGATTVTLSDGTSITVLNGLVTAANASTFFHG